MLRLSRLCRAAARCHYEVLGVKPGATADEIKGAFRERAKATHPDIAGGKDASGTFREMVDAYRVLRDPKKREEYDRQRSSYRSAAQGYQGAYSSRSSGSGQWPRGEGEGLSEEARRKMYGYPPPGSGYYDIRGDADAVYNPSGLRAEGAVVSIVLLGGMWFMLGGRFWLGGEEEQDPLPNRRPGTRPVDMGTAAYKPSSVGSGGGRSASSSSSTAAVAPPSAAAPAMAADSADFVPSAAAPRKAAERGEMAKQVAQEGADALGDLDAGAAGGAVGSATPPRRAGESSTSKLESRATDAAKAVVAAGDEMVRAYWNPFHKTWHRIPQGYEAPAAMDLTAWHKKRTDPVEWTRLFAEGKLAEIIPRGGLKERWLPAWNTYEPMLVQDPLTGKTIQVTTKLPPRGAAAPKNECEVQF